MAKKSKPPKRKPSEKPAEPAAPKRARSKPTMAKGKKTRRRSGGGSMGIVELAGPAGVALLAPKILMSVQKPEAGKEADDKTSLVLAGGAWYLSKGKYRKYAPMMLVLAAMAHRRKLVLSGEMNEDGKEAITAESATEGE